MYKNERGEFSNFWGAVAQQGYNEGQATTTIGRQFLLKLIKDNESFLDVGCAAGITCALLKEYRPSIKYKGVDYAKEMIDFARANHPGSDFEVQSAYELKEKDNSFDTVYFRHILGSLKGYEEAIKGAFRIAKKRVVLDMRRDFTKGDLPDRVHYYGKEQDTYVADYKWAWFNGLLRNLSVNVSYLMDEDIKPIQDSSVFVVIGKKLDDVIFDLDDFHKDNNNLELLLELKKRFPKLKVTLFAIPKLCPKDWLKGLKDKYGDWMSFGVHGWAHFTETGSPTECANWTEADTDRCLDRAEKFGVFDKVFKAPGWVMSSHIYKVLKRRGYAVADNWQFRGPYLNSGVTLPRYLTNHLWEVHGHIQQCNLNGLADLASTKCNFTKDTNFHTIIEAVNDTDIMNKRLETILQDLIKERGEK